MGQTTPTVEIFPEDYYNTAAHFGFSHFSDAWGEATAELGRTLQALENAHGRPPVFRREDLIGYHFLHYGADNEVTEEVLSGTGFDTDWARPLNDALPEVASGTRTLQPVDLGRVALGPDTEVDPSLEEWTNKVEIRGDGSRGNSSGAKRFGEFLYPQEGVLMRYLGRGSINMLEESSEGYVRGGGGFGGITLDRLSFHVDTFSVSDGSQTSIYNALSYDENAHCSLNKIVRAEGSVSL